MKQNWTYKKLGEVCQVTMGQSPDGASINCLEGIEFHQGKTCFGDRFLYRSNQFTTSPTKFAEANSVLLCVRAPVGFPNITNRRICIGRGLCSLSSTFELDNSFLFYALLGKQDYFEKNATGSTFKAISSKVVSNTIIPLPPLSTQQSIVAELDEINNLLSLKRKELETYDKLAQSLFYEMFGDPVENEKGWEVKKLGDVCKEIGDGLHGTPEYTISDTGCYFVNGNNLESGSIKIKKETKMVSIDTKKKYWIELDENTILISINGTLGKLAYYKGENIILGKSACYLKIMPEHVDKKYLYGLLSSNFFKCYMEDECTGTTIQNVSLKSMRTYRFSLPPLPLQQLFATRIEAIEKQKANVKAAIEKLETLLAARMQYWFE